MKPLREASTLGEKQELFAFLLSTLIAHAFVMGYRVRLGEVERSKWEAARKGMPNSNHTRRLAADLHLFKDGLYLDRTEDHRYLGEWWEGQHPLCRWGGRFNDGNHYSLEHDGVK